ncbi:MAG TPA: ANTAR domain-containing protein [Nocardioidaceae bacterium]
MTGTMDSAASLPGSAGSSEPDHDFEQITAEAALLEQAKGVLIFRYGIDADTAFGLIERWAAESDAGIQHVAHAVVHDICQGDHSEPTDPRLVRFLEEQLRHEFPGVECETLNDAEPVTVAIDQSDSSLDGVADAAREACRRGVPLELTVDLPPHEIVHHDQPDLERAHLMQRVDLALELARAVSPGLEVRLSKDGVEQPAE